jgi:peptidoglycan/LPS O-acetylase OafA/YrhL
MPFTSVKPIHQNYIPELDGLRGIAILLVVTFHYFPFLKIFSLGWIGVDLFFVLSGYLITSRLIFTLGDKKYFSVFYKNRALRIVPLYYATLICFYLIINIMVKEENIGMFQFYNDHIPSFVLFLENWSFIFTKQMHENHLQHFWTLAIEEQFYLIWPLLIYFFFQKSFFIKTLFISIVLIILLRSFLFFKYQGDELICFYNTFCRMDSFIIGGLLFFFHERSSKIDFKFILPAIIIIISVAITFSGTHSSSLFFSTIGYTLIAIFFAGIIHIAIKKKNNHLKAFLNRKWLINFGKISYGLYIFHCIILLFFRNKIAQYLSTHFSISNSISLGISLSLCLLISITLSVISYFYFEMFFLKRKLQPKPLNEKTL